MATDKTEQDNGEVGKEPDRMNPEDLPDITNKILTGCDT